MHGREIKEGLHPDRQKTDWAFFGTDKISDGQASVLKSMAESGGRCGVGGCGYHIAPAAFKSIVAALRRRGLVRVEGREVLLVEGEPTPEAEPLLPKPFMRVGRRQVKIFDGSQISSQDAIVWLDPRGDGLFYLLLPEEMASSFSVFDKRCRRTPDADFFAACGHSLPEVMACAETLSAEFAALNAGGRTELLWVHFEHADQGRSGRAETSLTFYFEPVVAIGKKLYTTDSLGALRPFSLMETLPHPIGSPELRSRTLERSRAVLIPHSPARLEALKALRERIQQASAEIQRLLHDDGEIERLDSLATQLALPPATGEARRDHEECEGCALQTAEPPRCAGHAAGPVSCGQFRDKNEAP